MEAARILVGYKQGEATQKETLLKLGYSETVASTPSLVWSSEGVREALALLGVRPDTIIAPVIDALQANQTATYRGEVIESNIPDHKERRQSAETLAKISGILKDTPTVNMNSLTVQPADMQNFDFDI